MTLSYAQIAAATPRPIKRKRHAGVNAKIRSKSSIAVTPIPRACKPAPTFGKRAMLNAALPIAHQAASAPRATWKDGRNTFGIETQPDDTPRHDIAPPGSVAYTPITTTHEASPEFTYGDVTIPARTVNRMRRIAAVERRGIAMTPKVAQRLAEIAAESKARSDAFDAR